MDMVQSGERNPDLRYVRKVSHRDATLLPPVRKKLRNTSNSNIGEIRVVLSVMDAISRSPNMQ